MEYDIKNYGQLKEALKRGFRNASHQNRYGYPLQRWIVKKNTKNIVLVQIDLANYTSSPNHDSPRNMSTEAGDASTIGAINIFGADSFNRFTFSGFPYHLIPKYPEIAPAEIGLMPVSQSEHGGFSHEGMYSLHVDPSDARKLRFVKALKGNSIWGRVYSYSSEDLHTSINAILTAQKIMAGLEEKLQPEADRLFASILKR